MLKTSFSVILVLSLFILLEGKSNCYHFTTELLIGRGFRNPITPTWTTARIEGFTAHM